MKYLLLAVLIPVSLFASDLEDLIVQGDNFWDQFENTKAVEKYEQAYKIAPNNYEVMLKLARTYNDAGEEFKEQHNRDLAKKYIDKGIKAAEEFQKKFPDSSKAYAYLALSYGNLAMFIGDKERIKLAKKIEENAKKAIKMDPDYYLPYVILGIYYRELASLSWIERLFANTFFGDVPEGTYEDSEKMFKKALQLRPDMVVATYQLAKTYRQMDRENEEKNLLKKVLKLPNENFRDVFAKEKSKRRLEELT